MLSPSPHVLALTQVHHTQLARKLWQRSRRAMCNNMRGARYAARACPARVAHVAATRRRCAPRWCLPCPPRHLTCAAAAAAAAAAAGRNGDGNGTTYSCPAAQWQWPFRGGTTANCLRSPDERPVAACTRSRTAPSTVPQSCQCTVSCSGHHGENGGSKCGSNRRVTWEVFWSGTTISHENSQAGAEATSKSLRDIMSESPLADRTERLNRTGMLGNEWMLCMH